MIFKDFPDFMYSCWCVWIFLSHAGFASLISACGLLILFVRTFLQAEFWEFVYDIFLLKNNEIGVGTPRARDTPWELSCMLLPNLHMFSNHFC